MKIDIILFMFKSDFNAVTTFFQLETKKSSLLFLQTETKTFLPLIITKDNHNIHTSDFVYNRYTYYKHSLSFQCISHLCKYIICTLTIEKERQREKITIYKTHFQRSQGICIHSKPKKNKQLLNVQLKLIITPCTPFTYENYHTSLKS